MRTQFGIGALALIVLAAALFFPTRARADDAWLGVSLQEIDNSLRDALELGDREGVLVSDVERDSPADEAGLEDGDVIVEIDGRAATSARRVVRAVERSDPGEAIEIVVLRDGERLTLEATLEEREEDVIIIPRRHGRSFTLPRIQTPELESLTHFFSRPRLGVETRRLDADLAPYFGVEAGDGVLVVEVMEDTPAEEAGLRTGDVILRVDDEAIDSPGDLRDLLLDFEGETVTLGIKRRNEDMAIEVTLEEGTSWLHGGRHGRRSFLRIPADEEDELREELEALREELEDLKETLRERR